jgi:CheY-like chemotaxis protein
MIAPREDRVRRPRVLVVDEDPAMLSVLGSLLHEEPYEVLFTPDPGRALQILEEGPPELLVADPRLRLEGGSEFLQLAHDRFPDVPQVALTESPGPKPPTAVRAPKPTEAVAFRRAVREALHAPAEETTPEPAARLGVEVLLVSPRDLEEATLAASLLWSGFTARTAGTLEEALAILRERPSPAIALVRMDMPELPGPALIAALRRASSGLSVFMLEGPSDPSIRREGYAAGAENLLPSRLTSHEKAAALVRALPRLREPRIGSLRRPGIRFLVPALAILIAGALGVFLGSLLMESPPKPQTGPTPVAPPVRFSPEDRELLRWYLSELLELERRRPPP